MTRGWLPRSTWLFEARSIDCGAKEGFQLSAAAQAQIAFGPNEKSMYPRMYPQHWRAAA
jgi:hypothetical protein